MANKSVLQFSLSCPCVPLCGWGCMHMPVYMMCGSQKRTWAFTLSFCPSEFRVHVVTRKWSPYLHTAALRIGIRGKYGQALFFFLKYRWVAFDLRFSYVHSYHCDPLTTWTTTTHYSQSCFLSNTHTVESDVCTLLRIHF